MPLGVTQVQADDRAAMTCMMHFAVHTDDSIPAGPSPQIPSGTISRWFVESLEAVKNAGGPRRNSVGFSATLSMPCAYPLAKPSQTYAILSSKLASMQLVLYGESVGHINYQRLRSVLDSSKAETTNDFSPTLVINSVEYFEVFNDLMKLNCHRFVSWSRVDQLLDELNLERAQIEQANSNQAAW
jgi:hypothetical protein